MNKEKEKEELIEKIKHLIKSSNDRMDLLNYLDEKTKKSLQGLLDLYQQEKEFHKEYENKFFKLLSSFDRLNELAETLRKENVELLIEKKQKELKVREKIKELEKSYEDSYAINILKELLEEE